MSRSSHHIAFFLPALNSGGAEKCFVLLAGWFAARGFSVDLLLVRKEGAYIPEVAPQIRVIELGGLGMVRSFWPLLSYVLKEKPDWIVAGLPGPNIFAVLAKIMSRAKTRVMITQHHPFSLNARGKSGLRRKVRTLCARWVFRRADRIVAVSSGVADDLALHTGVARARVAVVHNPLDLERIARLAGETPPHEWLVQKNGPVLLSVGRLAPPKDYDTLLEALAKSENVRLVILGEGDGKSGIERKIVALGLGGRVDLAGFSSNPYAFMRAADALVLSSRHEGFGNVLIEAMALGTPVIASDCPHGPGEILQKGQYGELVPVGDAAALAAAIGRVIAGAHPDKDVLTARARDFDLSAVAEQYKNILVGDCQKGIET